MGLGPEQRIFQEERKITEEYIRSIFRKLGKNKSKQL